MNAPSDMFNGFYRGMVIDNKGERGKCKIFIPGTYPDDFKNTPENLPWAEPAMGLFGGHNNGQGMTEWPQVSAWLWCFFDHGSHNHPVYFAACQGSQERWHSEHNQQYSIYTKNVHIKIDDYPTSGTLQFDSYNANNTHIGVLHQVPDIQTTVYMECTGNVNIIVNGSVNMQVNGNMYSEVNGSRFDTVSGNYYLKVNGDMHKEITGAYCEEVGKNKATFVVGDNGTITSGDFTNVINKNYMESTDGSKTISVNDYYAENVQNKVEQIMDGLVIKVGGTYDIASVNKVEAHTTVESAINTNNQAIVMNNVNIINDNRVVASFTENVMNETKIFGQSINTGKLFNLTAANGSITIAGEVYE